jgi:nicotinamide mononucleotide transporter
VSLETLLNELRAWSPVEATAAGLALAYLVFAARQSLWCWPCAFVSTAIYFVLFLERQLYQQSLLQIFYLGMAVYGFVHWRHARGAPAIRDKNPSSVELRVTSWPRRRHLQAASGVFALTCLTGWLEARYTAAPMPYLDAFTTWGSVVTTWMVARKVLENWLYWLVVDGVLVYVYFRSGLPATTVLFVIYLAIVIAGYLSWRRTLFPAALQGGES